jgi:hypothetical protein
MTRRSRLAIALLCALIAAPLAPAAAHAAGNGRWSVTPTPPKDAGPAPRVYFFLESPPGQTVIDSVRVENLTDKPLALTVYPADAFNTVNDGGFGLLSAEDTQHDIGAWTRVSATAIVVAGKSHADIPFTITVPSNAPPGDHVGGIVAAEATPSGETSDGGTNVAIRQAVAARLYLRVSGTAVPGLAITDLAAGKREITYTVANTGNVHLAPAIETKTHGLFGHTLTTGVMPQLDLIPGARSKLRTAVSGAWPVDIVTTTVTMTADGGVRTSAATTTLIGVWPALAVLVALGAVVFWLLRRRHQARRLRPRRLA